MLAPNITKGRKMVELTQWEIRAILISLRVAQNEGMGGTFDPENIGELEAKLRALTKPQ